MRALLFAGLAAFADASGPFPVIAIMSHPAELERCGSCEYIAASYVKFVEMAGARAVPVSYYATDGEIDDLASQVNGFLFPGGGCSLPPAARRVVAISRNISANGGHLPVFGTCLGFEWIAEAIGGEGILMNGLDAENISLPLTLTADGEASRLYADRAAREILKTKPVTMNLHHQGLSPAEYARNPALRDTLKVLSTNVDRKGREFVSSFEARSAPIYGVQYHPEKNAFEWGTNPDGRLYLATQHTAEAVQVTQSIANVFVGEARKSRNVYNLTSTERPFFENVVTSTELHPKFVEIYVVPRGAPQMVVYV